MVYQLLIRLSCSPSNAFFVYCLNSRGPTTTHATVRGRLRVKLRCRRYSVVIIRSAPNIVGNCVQVDASGRGLAAVLLQGGKPIAFASKSLSECKKRYANIEREMLAVVFGCERFHTCVRHHNRHGPVHDKQRVVRNRVGIVLQVPVRLPDSQLRDERRFHLKDEIALRRTRSATTCSQR